jgi:hypothetical protein
MALYRVDFQGALHGAETFQHGHHVESSGSSTDVADDAAAQWLAILAVSAFAELFHTGIQWTQVNVSELGASPADPVVTSAQTPIADGGTSTSNPLPNQIALVVSLLTAEAGSRARGRMFLPPPDLGVLTTTGRLGSAEAVIIADNMEDYFNNMEAAGHVTNVVSGVGGVYTARAVNNIRIGNVFDTQRGRRNSLAEVYTLRAI